MLLRLDMVHSLLRVVSPDRFREDLHPPLPELPIEPFLPAWAWGILGPATLTPKSKGETGSQGVTAAAGSRHHARVSEPYQYVNMA